MAEEARQGPADTTRAFMNALASWIAPRFPHHATAIQQELGRERLTTDRWNRIASLLAALHAMPGSELTPTEHDVRNIALSAVVVAQKMAAAGLGSTRDPDGCIDFAAWLAEEISGRMRHE